MSRAMEISKQRAVVSSEDVEISEEVGSSEDVDRAMEHP